MPDNPTPQVPYLTVRTLPIPEPPAPVFTAAEWEAEKRLDHQMDLQADADRE